MLVFPFSKTGVQYAKYKLQKILCQMKVIATNEKKIVNSNSGYNNLYKNGLFSW